MVTLLRPVRSCESDHRQGVPNSRVWPPALLVAVTLLLCLAGCASGPRRPEPIPRGDYTFAREHIRWFAQRKLAEHKVVGAAVALVDDQEVVFAEGFGWADREAKTPATDETVFQVGSISKLFTAMAAMQLQEQGRLDIDRPLQAYLPDFAIGSRFPNAPPITLRSILTHHSGLPSDYLKGMWRPAPEPFNALPAKLAAEYVAFPPDFVFAYSNLGVALLGCAIENASGRPFAQYVHDSLLAPLGMSRSSFERTDAINEKLSKAYLKGRQQEVYALRDLPAGSLMSSARDMAAFARMIHARGTLANAQILREPTFAEMLRPQNETVALDFDLRVGLGFFILPTYNDEIGPIVGHDGSTLTHNASLAILPKHKLAVVVLTNSDTGADVTEAIAHESLSVALETKTGLKLPPLDGPPAADAAVQDGRPASGPAETPTSSPQDLARLAGTYVTAEGLLKIKADGERLRATTESGTLYFIPQGGGTFRAQVLLLGLLPIAEDQLRKVRVGFARVGARDVLYGYYRGIRVLFGERIRPPEVPQSWRERVGEYELVDRGEDYRLFDNVRLTYRDGLLTLSVRLPDFDDSETLVLAPLSDSEAIAMGLGRGLGETIRVEPWEGRESLAFSGYHFVRK